MRGNIPQKILESVESIPLPPLPQVLIRFLTLVEDDAAPLEKIAAVVAQDPALAAHLLTVANSPFFRKEPATYGLMHCLKAIGPRMLRTVATAMAVQNVFIPTIGEQNLDYAGYWGNSLRVAELARALAMAINYPDAEEAYLGGLLHDIGQLLLVGGLAEGYCLNSGVSEQAVRTDCRNSPDVAFRALLGSRLVDQWNLSSFMADAVLFHRHPVQEISSADLLSRIVWSAHKLSGCDTAEDASLLSDIAVIRALIGIDADGISAACRYAGERAAKAAASLGVDLSRAGRIFLRTSFITQEQSFTQGRKKDAAGLRLESQIKTMAVMQPLQENLLALSGEAELYGALRESARILFGLGRPVLLVVHPGKQVLIGVELEGQSLLLPRLEIQLDAAQSLAASVVRENRARASYDEDYPSTPFLSDIQLGRIMRTEGLLCIPMHDSGRTIGVMVYGVTAERCSRTLGSRDWMTGFASVAARTLEAYRRLRDGSQAVTAELTRNFEQRARKVVHEAVNPLSIINNYLQIVSEKLGEETGVGKELEILKEELARVERIIRRQVEDSEHTPAVETVNVNSVIEGMLALYGESLFGTSGIVIDRQLAPETPVAGADRDSLKQILLNLWKNSAEAMPDGGRLSISTRVTTEDKECGSVEIRLSDSGPGIPPDVMECLFQPLDPERRRAHSGVGLSIVASLVERHGGKISCLSSPDKGTDFTIHLPQA